MSRGRSPNHSIASQLSTPKNRRATTAAIAAAKATANTRTGPTTIAVNVVASAPEAASPVRLAPCERLDQESIAR
jgi:hypothetical protein